MHISPFAVEIQRKGIFFDSSPHTLFAIGAPMELFTRQNCTHFLSSTSITLKINHFVLLQVNHHVNKNITTIMY